jgi:hypothetical protein
MNHSLPVLFMVAVFLTAGCTHTNEPVALSTTVITVSPTPDIPFSVIPAVTEKPLQKFPDDRAFLDAVDICYANTPVITSIRTNMDFTVCMQHTPLPTGTCAQRFRREILQYTTKDDDTTAGYARETYNMGVARVRFSECLGTTK